MSAARRLTGIVIAAGDNNIGNVDIVSLPAIPAGTNNIGDVDVLTVPSDPFGANADAAATAGSVGTIQAKLRLATSQLDSIKTAIEALDNAISGSEIQVDVVTLPALTTGTNIIGAIKDAGANWTQSDKLISSSDASSSDVDASDAPTSGQKVVVDDIVVSVDTAMRVDFKEETSGTIRFSVYLPINGTFHIAPRGKAKLATADKKLLCRTSASGNIRATVLWHSEA